MPDVGSLSGAASSLFTLKPGEISGPISTGSNGVVAQLLEKQAPTDQDFAAKKDQIRQTLLDSKQNEMFSLFRVEPAQGNGKIEQAQGQSGRNEEPDSPRSAEEGS